MSQVKSSLGKKEIQGTPLKTFDVHNVEDEEMMRKNFDEPVVNPLIQKQLSNKDKFNQDLEAIKQAEVAAEKRRRAVSGKERLSTGALDRISILLGITQQKKIVSLDDNVSFELRSIKSSESRDILKAAGSVNRLEYAFEIRRQCLARSLVSISGVSIEEFICSSELEDKLLFIDELDDAVAARLYKEYATLKQETDSYYAIKTPEDAKEIVEDLKKS